MKRDLTDAEWLAKIEWDALPVDFTGPKHKLSTRDWAAWAGYEPSDHGSFRAERLAADQYAHLTPAIQARIGIKWWDAWR